MKDIVKNQYDNIQSIFTITFSRQGGQDAVELE